MIQTFKQGKKLIGSGSSGNCNCFAGTAYFDGGGGCKCHPNADIPPFPFGGTDADQIAWRNEYLGGGVDPIETEGPPETGGVKAPRGMRWTPAGWVPMKTKMAWDTQQTDTEENTIFGLSPLVVLGAAVVGLWILSSMDGKK